MTGPQAVARLPARRDNASAPREVVDPRLEPFLRALADLIARQVLQDLDTENRRIRDHALRDLRPQEH